MKRNIIENDLHIFDAKPQFLGYARVKQGGEIAETAIKDLGQELSRPGVTGLLCCRDVIRRDDAKQKFGKQGIVFLPFLSAHFHQRPSQWMDISGDIW